MKTFFTVKFALLPIAVFVFLIVRGMPAAAIGGGFVVALDRLRLAALCARYQDARDCGARDLQRIGRRHVPRPGRRRSQRGAVGVHRARPVFDCDGLFGKALDGRVLPRRVSGGGRESGLRAGQHDPLRALGCAVPAARAGARLESRRHRHHGHRGCREPSASILGPGFLARMALARQMRALETYHWPAPALGGAQGDDDFDVAVVGAGIGGLTAAALLADAGLKVVVAEQHFQPGGFCQTFQRKLHHDGVAARLSFRCRAARFLRRRGWAVR